MVTLFTTFVYCPDINGPSTRLEKRALTVSFFTPFYHTSQYFGMYLIAISIYVGTPADAVVTLRFGFLFRLVRARAIEIESPWWTQHYKERSTARGFNYQLSMPSRSETGAVEKGKFHYWAMEDELLPKGQVSYSFCFFAYRLKWSIACSPA